MKPKKLLVELIEETADTQSRKAISPDTIKEYAKAMASGDEFPPIDVFFDGDHYFIGDGWHRFYAWIEAGITLIPCHEHDGGERDALFFAAGANAPWDKSGLKRTTGDKRRSVEILLADEVWGAWSDRRIAEHCGVSNNMVSDMRRDREQVSLDDTSVARPVPATPPPARRVLGRDGKSYPVKPKPAAPAPDEEEESGPDLAALSLPYRESAKLIDEMRRKFESLAKKPEGAQLVPKIQRLASEFAAVKATIRGAEPLALCGKCAGEGCQHCARTGWWTRMVVESLKK